MSFHLGRCLVLAVAAAGLLGGCEGKVNDDENFFVLTFRASLDPAGTELTGPSERARITPDGRFVVFQSRADNLVPGDLKGKFDIFRKEVSTGAVSRVSIEGIDDGDPSDGSPTDINPANPNQDCLNPSITPDGRYVVFQSRANDLADDDPADNGNLQFDIFRRDLQTGVTDWISVPAVAGVEANGDSFNATISNDGRYVAFESVATNLVLTDSNGGNSDIFVRDMLFGTTALVSATATGVQSNSASNNAVISGDGQIVAFESIATNLVTGDTNGLRDIFAKEWLASTPVIARVSVEGPGEPDGVSDLDNANGPSTQPAISQDGRFIAFVSAAPDLVSGDNNPAAALDVFIRDMSIGKTTRCSVSSRGGEASKASGSPQISQDGRWVTFHSEAADLIPSDTNNAIDIFLRDTVSNTTTRISVATYGVESSAFFDSTVPSVTSDGRFVAFTSLAPNLAPNDTNGTSDIYIRGPLY